MSALLHPMRFVAWLGMALAWPLFAASSAPAYIPLEKGNFWIYEGDVSWVENDPQTQKNKIYTRHLTWRSEVTDVVKTDRGTVALLHGFPTDLAWYNSKTQPGDRLLLLLGTDYFEITQNPLETFRKIKDSNGDWMTCFKEIAAAELFSPTPLVEGKCFGGSPGNFVMGRYCDVVDEVAPFDPASIQGAPKLVDPVCFDISDHTNPDIEEMEVVPGLGVVGFGYHHNGTTMEVSVNLVEFGHAR
jgi:hypothetical protein